MGRKTGRDDAITGRKKWDDGRRTRAEMVKVRGGEVNEKRVVVYVRERNTGIVHVIIGGGKMYEQRKDTAGGVEWTTKVAKV